MRDIKVDWSGSYPNLCSGKWTISFDGKQVKVPSALVGSPMETSGVYESWHFGGDSGWEEIFESYENGYSFQEWILKNKWIFPALKSIGVTDVTEQECQELFSKIQSEDWRSGSCGGCI